MATRIVFQGGNDVYVVPDIEDAKKHLFRNGNFETTQGAAVYVRAEAVAYLEAVSSNAYEDRGVVTAG